MRSRIITGAAVLAAMALGGAGIATASSGPAGNDESASSAPAGNDESASSAPAGNGSRLDDGADLLSQARISEQRAISAAQSAASGSLNAVDLEDYQGHLVFNVDVGASDVKVDASTGSVLATPSDD